ncbi:helix-turn-helix domain-containing protein [Streptomyces sp. ISL-98]|uniref:helix-turn-helix domain-containing protein n=1 Tax=Streptomyces sp. ISL-98 TaxID=2819192 RepID=UPI001BE6433B|nr:helix-turn-helix transcriptional regulator [Streptomyces sp. ISL-98]MBT2506003.1 helix-turn-helix domain-containing protein [Streptomyces sp. ISL-98]
MDDKEALRVGTAVRRRRKSMVLTLATVAARSGLSVPFLSQIENERARPSTRSLERVAEALETTAAELIAAADSGRTVDVVRATEEEGARDGDATGVRCVVRGRHQLRATEYTGEQDTGREFQHHGDELMYIADGAAEVEAEGRAYRLERGDTLFLSGGVRHRWRATVPGTRILVVAAAGTVGHEAPGIVGHEA